MTLRTKWLKEQENYILFKFLALCLLMSLWLEKCYRICAPLLEFLIYALFFIWGYLLFSPILKLASLIILFLLLTLKKKENNSKKACHNTYLPSNSLFSHPIGVLPCDFSGLWLCPAQQSPLRWMGAQILQSCGWPSTLWWWLSAA